MPLLKHGKFVDDPWRDVGDDATVPVVGPVIFSLARWRVERDELLTRETPLGLRLKSDQSPIEVADDIDLFNLLALEFPVFTDGRSYSNAKRLRDRYGFTGEIRAVGDVLRDQYAFMRRCGFDAMVVKDGETEADWAAAVGAVSVVYQAASDGAEAAMFFRQRRRSR